MNYLSFTNHEHENYLAKCCTVPPTCEQIKTFAIEIFQCIHIYMYETNQIPRDVVAYIVRNAILNSTSLSQGNVTTFTLSETQPLNRQNRPRPL